MPRPMIRIHDTETDVVIDREMNDEEFSEYSTKQLAETARIAEEQALATTKASAIANLIAGNPLTPEEAATIVI